MAMEINTSVCRGGRTREQANELKYQEGADLLVVGAAWVAQHAGDCSDAIARTLWERIHSRKPDSRQQISIGCTGLFANEFAPT
jgi:hypothetical protein